MKIIWGGIQKQIKDKVLASEFLTLRGPLLQVQSHTIFQQNTQLSLYIYETIGPAEASYKGADWLPITSLSWQWAFGFRAGSLNPIFKSTT